MKYICLGYIDEKKWETFSESDRNAIMIMWAWPGPVLAQDTARFLDKSFALYWDNDYFAGTDRDYTNGLKFTYSQAVKENHDEDANLLSRWGRPLLNWLPLVLARGFRHLSHSAGV
jgi:hypothetical protein